MAESAVNARLMTILRGMHPFRVENPACPGTPDIKYVGAWIESKWLPRWPTKGNVVKVDHFTPQQRCWHKLEALAGGVSYVVIKVEDTWLLFRGYDAAESLGKMDETQLRKMALGVWERHLNEEQFLAAIVTE